MPLSPTEIAEALERIPRVELAHLPTPFEELPSFAEAIGGGVRVFIKRDDCTGLLLGGNKTRHAEFLMGDALELDCDMVVWGAGVQSNNCRQTAAACAKLGLPCHLYLSGSPAEPQGNLLLDHLVGAHVEFTYAKIGPELDAHLEAMAERFRKRGHNPYVWDRKRVVPRAAISYVECMVELADDLETEEVEAAAIYVSSAGGTGAGVALGAHLLGMTAMIRLICPMTWPWNIPEALAADANAAAELLELPHRLTARDIDTDESYIAPGYGSPSKAGQEALHLLARTEAILLDPVYTAKAMAALIAEIRAGRYPRGSAVIFIHTGGVPAIFADPAGVMGAG